MLVVRLVWFPCLHKIGRDSKFFSAGSTQGDEGWREAAAGAGARGRPAQGSRWQPSTTPAPPGPRQDTLPPRVSRRRATTRKWSRCRKCRRLLPHAPGPTESSRLVAPSPAVTHLGSRRRLLCGRSRRNRGPRADEQEGTADWSPGARGSQGPAARPSRLTQIAEAPGEEPLAARGSRLLPPALFSLGLPACFSPPAESWAPRCVPQAGSEAAAPSTLRVPWPIAATDGLYILRAPLANTPFWQSLNVPSVRRRHHTLH